MFEPADFQPDHSADVWAIRSEFWNSETGNFKLKRGKRERNSTPLILCGHGVSMRIENGALVIRDGFTHYPQEQATYRYFRGELSLPPRIILLDGSGTLSFDVLSWLGEQGVTLARIKWNGEIAVAAAGSGFAADPKKVEWQRNTRADETLRIAFAADLIRRKLIASIPTLERHISSSSAKERALQKADLGIARLSSSVLADVKAIYAIEGECAVAYFAAWQSVSLPWKGTARKHIPDDWQGYTSRNSQLSGKVAKNRMASNPINAMLNYAYTVRQTQLQIEAVAQGYDPTIGIMHNRHQGSSAYILDLIEPERPKVDAAILAFIANRSFTTADFIIRKDGVCRLSPQLARALAVLTAQR